MGVNAINLCIKVDTGKFTQGLDILSKYLIIGDYRVDATGGVLLVIIGMDDPVSPEDYKILLGLDWFLEDKRVDSEYPWTWFYDVTNAIRIAPKIDNDVDNGAYSD